jgi:hypothetical protein
MLWIYLISLFLIKNFIKNKLRNCSKDKMIINFIKIVLPLTYIINHI